MNVSDPFDEQVIRGMLGNSPERVRKTENMLLEHAQANAGYVAWSGGKDSTVVAHLAVTRQLGLPLVWFHSGLEFPETEEYIHELAAEWNADLVVVRAKPDALTLLEESGFWDHDASTVIADTSFHDVLIRKPSEAAHTRFGPGEALGLRATESAGRRALLASTGGVYARRDGTRVCAPIWAWKDQDVTSYLAEHGVPLNPVYAKQAALGVPPQDQRAGLVLDGNALDRSGRATWIRLGWPNLWADLCDRLPRLTEWR